MRERHSMDGRLDLIGRYARKEAQMEIKMLLVMFIKCLFDVCHSSCDDNCWHMLATHYLSPIIISIFLKYSWVLNQKELILCFDPVSETLSAYKEGDYRCCSCGVQQACTTEMCVYCVYCVYCIGCHMWMCPSQWIKMAVMEKKWGAVAPTDMAHHGAKANRWRGDCCMQGHPMVYLNTCRGCKAMW